MRKLVLALALMIVSANSFAWRCCKKDGGGDAPGVYGTKKGCEKDGHVVSPGLVCPWRCYSQYFLMTNGYQHGGTDEKYLGLTDPGDWSTAKTNCKNMAQANCSAHKLEAVKKVYPNGVVPLDKCNGTSLGGNTKVTRGSESKTQPKEAVCSDKFSVSFRCNPGSSMGTDGKCYACPANFVLKGTKCVQEVNPTVSNGIPDKCNY